MKKCDRILFMAKEKRTAITHLMLERLLNIHKKIKSGAYPNTNQLAKEFNDNRGTATISRDIEFLRDRFGAPIAYDYKRRGYYYTEDFNLPLNSISRNNLLTLLAAKQLLSHFRNTPFYSEISDVLDFLSDSRSNDSGNLIGRISLPPTPEFIVEEKVWQVVSMGLESNTKIEFDYSGRWNTKTTHRKVHPYQLVMDDGKCFLFGYSEERQDVRLFALGKIQNPRTTNESFILPKNHDFESRCGGGKFGSFSSSKIERYRIEFYENARQMVKECIWAEDQVLKDDDSRDCTTISFSSTQFLKIEEWVLSQGCYARPLRPKWLVEEWKGHIRQMMKLAGI